VVRAGETVASILVSAEYRDDPQGDGMCTAHPLEPASFLVMLPAGGSLTLVNAVAPAGQADGAPTGNGGLATCRGELNTGTGFAQISTGNAVD
jgi:hypothetical protein